MIEAIIKGLALFSGMFLSGFALTLGAWGGAKLGARLYGPWKTEVTRYNYNVSRSDRDE